MSSIRTGDAVFIRSGNPGIVKGRDERTGKLELNTELATVQKDMRHGYINGLQVADREKLNEILDTVKGDSMEPRERVDTLQARISELEEDPKHLPLVRYLRAEMTHIMNSHQIQPRQYSAHETKLR